MNDPGKQPDFSQILRWIDQLDRRVSQVESRLADLANQASDQGEAFRMMCSVIKNIEDPYGFGVSLDERILGDAGHATTDEQED